MNKLKVDNG